MVVCHNGPKNHKERPPMKKYTRKLGKVIQIDETKIREHMGELVRRTVEETFKKLLDAEADQLCNAARYVSGGAERYPGRAL
jgi:hypothetical protein